MFKSGFVTIIGRPNVGKSTLTNYLLGEKLSIVSNKPQTTRNNIQTVLTGEDYQLVFVDTPGIHKPKHKLGEYMVDIATESINNVDLVLFLTTADVELGKGDLYILEQLKNINKPVFLVVNKIDESNPERIAKTLENYGDVYGFKEIIPISAKNGKNVDTLLNLMIDNMPEGPMYYPKDMIADVQERFVVTEIIREKALRLLKEEVPHGIAVEVVSMKQTQSGKYKIDVNIICEKKSHKGIIIGKQGTMLGKITRYAEEDMKTFLGEKVDLTIWVKVRKEWRDDNNLLRELGYKK
ncbi:GTPase Era [Haloimpatiens massiliensis]|uniref:GTPase Era n=1 Tax=Haloimpatiens massiliensis TaxID=1658110 RepID=UPI000C84ECD4|nr:GTPase Era [Haloimpatiens massiliensis]